MSACLAELLFECGSLRYSIMHALLSFPRFTVLLLSLQNQGRATLQLSPTDRPWQWQGLREFMIPPTGESPWAGWRLIVQHRTERGEGKVELCSPLLGGAAAAAGRFEAD